MMAPMSPSRKLAAPPKAIVRNNRSRPKAVREMSAATQEREISTKVQEMFRLADCDFSGAVQFHEFAQMHSDIVRLAGEKLGGCATSAKAILEAFRKQDADHSLSLDAEEFMNYMRGIQEILGERSLLEICMQLMEDKRQNKADADGLFDKLASNKLLDLVRNAHSLQGPNAERVMELLGQKANPDFHDLRGANILLHAVGKAEPDLLASLLAARANPAKHSTDMDCAVFAAARDRSLPALRVLLLPRAAGTASSEQLELSQRLRDLLFGEKDCGQDVLELLSQGMNIGARDEQGWTPVLHAAFTGKEHCLKAMLSYASTKGQTHAVNLADLQGRSAMHLSARKGFAELLRMLARAGASVNAQDSDGMTPLHLAVENGHDECVIALLGLGASPTMRDYVGLTPWMTASAPGRAADLGETALKMLDPHEHMSFSVRIIPIITSGRSPPDMLQEIRALPNVAEDFMNLRLYDAFFSLRSGPKKVRLLKWWEGILRPLLRAHLSVGVDVEPLPAGAVKQREEQSRFLKFCLEETQGPPEAEHWEHSNREAYQDDLTDAMRAYAEGFRSMLVNLRSKLQGLEGGDVLCKLPRAELLHGDVLDQCSVHPVLKWLDTLDVVQAFDALRCLRKDLQHDDEALVDFIMLTNTHDDFCNGASYWQHVYKMWLSRYAELAHHMFQTKLRKVIEHFNQDHASEGIEAQYYSVAPKSYDAMAQEEHKLGRVVHDTTDGRRRASRFMDVLRCGVTVTCPKVALMLLDQVFRPMKMETDKLRLLRVLNGFHEDAAYDSHYCQLLLHVQYDGGLFASCTAGNTHLWNKDMEVKLIGEVRIDISEFLSVRKRTELINSYLNGAFDQR